MRQDSRQEKHPHIFYYMYINVCVCIHLHVYMSKHICMHVYVHIQVDYQLEMFHYWKIHNYYFEQHFHFLLEKHYILLSKSIKTYNTCQSKIACAVKTQILGKRYVEGDYFFENWKKFFIPSLAKKCIYQYRNPHLGQATVSKRALLTVEFLVIIQWK